MEKQDNQTDNEEYNGQIELYQKGELANPEVVAKELGLSKKLVSTITKLSEKGFSTSQIESLVDIVEIGGAGKTQKTRAFLEALNSHYSPGYLETVPHNYDKFNVFLESLEKVESLREEIKEDWGVSISYKKCLGLLEKLSPEEIMEFLDEQHSEEIRGVDREKGYRKTDLLEKQLEESPYSPQSLSDFGEGKLDEESSVPYVGGITDAPKNTQGRS